MPLRWSVRQLVLGLVLLQAAFGIRLAAAQWWESRLGEHQPFAFGDSDGYWELARTIAEGEEYRYGSYRVFRTPGYPLLLAPLFLLAGDHEPPVMWARIEGALLGTLAVGLVVLVTRTLFTERAAWIAGLIATFYPGQIASSIFVLSEAPFMPLMLAHLLAWQQATRSDARRQWLLWSALGGLICGLAILVRPSWLLFVPFAGGLVVLLSRERWKHAQIVAVMLMALCVTMAPWWVRNYRVTGTFVPTSLQVGISLADGWNPKADGGSDLNRAAKALYLQALVDLPPLDEVGQNAWCRRVAWQWAQANPRRVLELAGIKFLRMWNVVPNASEFGGWTFRTLYAVTYTPLLIGCLLGLWKFRSRGLAIWLWFLPAVYFTLLHMIFVASIRYQQPALLAWMPIGAGYLATLLPTGSTRDATRP